MQATIPVLENDLARLSGLSVMHCNDLWPVATQEKLIQYSPSDVSTPAALRKYIEIALEKFQDTSAIPFVIFDKRVQKYAGSTRYMNIDWTNKVLEIGSTWIGREFQGSGLNDAVKALMLKYAFTELNFEKVEFRIDERNMRSRKAVEKLGATLEGILRENVYLLDGFKRNTCCYGLLKREWDMVL